jgi:hypothetical protein
VGSGSLRDEVALTSHNLPEIMASNAALGRLGERAELFRHIRRQHRPDPADRTQLPRPLSRSRMSTDLKF